MGKGQMCRTGPEIGLLRRKIGGNERKEQLATADCGRLAR